MATRPDVCQHGDAWCGTTRMNGTTPVTDYCSKTCASADPGVPDPEPFAEGWLDRQMQRSKETLDGMPAGVRESMGLSPRDVPECSERGCGDDKHGAAQ